MKQAYSSARKDPVFKKSCRRAVRGADDDVLTHDAATAGPARVEYQELSQLLVQETAYDCWPKAGPHYYRIAHPQAAYESRWPQGHPEAEVEPSGRHILVPATEWNVPRGAFRVQRVAAHSLERSHSCDDALWHLRRALPHLQSVENLRLGFDR